MTRRSFLKFCGIAPALPMMAVEVISNPCILVNHNTPGIDKNILMPNFIVQIDTTEDVIRAASIIMSHTGKFPPTYAISKENYERLNL